MKKENTTANLRVLLLLLAVVECSKQPSEKVKEDEIKKEQFFKTINSGDAVAVGEMLRSGVDANLRTKSCCSYKNAPALICAVCKKQFQIVKLLLQHKADVRLRDGEDGGTALIWASRTGNTDIVKLLLEKGANVDATTWYQDETALMWASTSGNMETVQLLVKYKANVRIHQKQGYTAEILARMSGNMKIAQYLYQASGLSHNERLADYMVSGYRVGVNQELEKGANPNIKGDCCTYKNAPILICAVCLGDYDEIVEDLINHGADFEETDNDGGTALIWASRKGSLKSVEVLLKHGANVNARTRAYSDTALMFAAMNGHLEIVELLLFHGADLTLKQNGGETALSLAKGRKQQKVVNFLETFENPGQRKGNGTHIEL